MATIKSYTDLQQAKKLAEILPLKSADMVYVTTGYSTRALPKEDVDANTYPQVSLCWSLAALLQVLPLGIYDELDGCDYELEIDMINKMPRYIRLGDIYHSQFLYDFEKDTLLDNIVESIIWLNDNNYFEL